MNRKQHKECAQTPKELNMNKCECARRTRLFMFNSFGVWARSLYCFLFMFNPFRIVRKCTFIIFHFSFFTSSSLRLEIAPLSILAQFAAKSDVVGNFSCRVIYRGN
jgi:hypothetical protein